ncbi:hypothetical protein [Streptomyces sp. NBC_01207]|uniref:hypothetical protein n=1 Tax=Streptomyces sp. NBC_01207 TaxID=2903772 RepID=UPI002E105352|nr:hypothetical protein OG457_46705 [Streptomyces sp. NBC_01207]
MTDAFVIGQREAAGNAAREAAEVAARQAGLSEGDQKKFGDSAFEAGGAGYDGGGHVQHGFQPPQKKDGGK